ncbi:tetratricopeptide repeat protein [Kitasatospora sp. NPDC058170]|uniref:tetratricopeptide repeat protein n=1 Tax=Kitasatospora sp. NPDC058170 TaxID=3346364 RepID=UPI0036D8A6A1
MGERAGELYARLRTLRDAARAARVRSGLPWSAREAERQVRRSALPDAERFRAQRISDWVPDDPAAAKVPAPAGHQQVLALVAVWSDWAGLPVDARGWSDLLDRAQPVRAQPERGRDAAGPDPAAVPPRLASLPGLPDGLAGRESELGLLLGLLGPADDGGAVTGGEQAAQGAAQQAVVVASMAGLGGVGKTTLALAAAHEALRRGWFDGVLFVDFHGYDPQPLQAAQALESLLRTLEPTTEHIPPSADDRAALYRARLAALADQGRRILVIADNVSQPSQVRPLHPGAGAHRLLATSRHTLPTLGARLLDLDVLQPDGALELLDRALRTADPADGRVTADPGAAAEVARLCGWLPLALQIAAALLIRSPGRSPARLAAELTRTGRRLSRLDDGERTVRVSLDLSYRLLTDEQRELFHRLALAPGQDFATWAAAALAAPDGPDDHTGDHTGGHTDGDGVGFGPEDVEEVEERLDELARAHLLERGPGHPGRWRMHDLVREYALEGGADAGREQALARLLEAYSALAGAAGDDLYALPGGEAPGLFADPPAALAWLDTERANLIGAVHAARRAGLHRLARELPLNLGRYLNQNRYFDDLIDITEVAREAARAVGDRLGEARTWNNLGLSFGNLRRADEAIDAHRRAIALFQDLGDLQGEARAWNNLGLALRLVRRFDESVEAQQRDIAISRELGDRHGEATGLTNLGTALNLARRLDEAVAVGREAVELLQRTGDRYAEGMAWHNLGTALNGVRRFEEAAAAHERAITIHRETGDRHSEAGAVNGLGAALMELHRVEEAVTTFEHAIALHQEVDDRHGEAMARDNLGTALRRSGRSDEAVDAHRQVVEFLRETGDPHGEAGAANGLGAALRAAHQPAEAVIALEYSAGLLDELGDRHQEAMSRNNLGSALHDLTRFDEAAAAYERAIALYRESGDRNGTAGALNGLGVVLRDLARFDEAVTTLTEAAALHWAEHDRRGEAMAWNNLGIALCDADRLDEAVAAGERAVALYHELGTHYEEATARWSLAATLVAAGRDSGPQWAAAAAAFERAGAAEEAAESRRLEREEPGPQAAAH